jgi:uncharacterized membrane protein
VRTLVIILCGFALWAVCLAGARLLAGTGTSSTTAATTVFIILWFLAAAVNLWVGVVRAGYSFREELPIFLLIFLLPSAIAALVRWKYL